MKTLRPGSEVVAGPVHPAFGQLVKSWLMLQCIEEIISKNGFRKHDEKNAGYRLVISAGPSDISYVAGHKKSNIIYLKNVYKFGRVKTQSLKESQGEISVSFVRI
jgi:hypothetical protein